jgi:hypothetical protein
MQVAPLYRSAILQHEITLSTKDVENTTPQFKIVFGISGKQIIGLVSYTVAWKF